MPDSNIPYQDPTTINRRLGSESVTQDDATVVEHERVQSHPRKKPKTVTTTVLGIGAVFAQAWQDALEDGAMYVVAAARANVASAANGFIIEETQDDTDVNFTRLVAQVTVGANSTVHLAASIRAGAKWRIKYTNGGTAQTSFKITSVSTAAFADDGSTQSNAPAQTSVGITAAEILAANPIRKSFSVLNTGTTVIKLTLSDTDPTQTVYHFALKAASAADAGDGGALLDDEWKGAVRAISAAAGGTAVVTETT